MCVRVIIYKNDVGSTYHHSVDLMDNIRAKILCLILDP